MAKRTREDQGFAYTCSVYLRQRWEEVQRRFQEAMPDEPAAPLGEDHALIPLIRDCLRSTALTYHYVLPTQLLAKEELDRVNTRIEHRRAWANLLKQA